MRKPSILFLNRVYAPAKGATGRMLSDLAGGFAAQGWDVNVITTGVKTESRSQNGVFVSRIKARTSQTVLNYLWIWLRIFIAAYRFRPTDLIVTMTDPPLLVVAGRLLSKSKRTPHIHWCQDMYPDLLPVLDIFLPNPVMKYLKLASLRSLQRCTKVIAIGRCMADRLGRMEFDHRRLITIPNWPDREFHQTNPTQFHAEPRLNNPDKPLIVNADPKFRVLYAGNIGRAHPVATILDAATLLQISNPEIEFLFVGEGEGHERLAAERVKRGLENIRLLPTQPKFQLREMMQSGDLHLISLKNNAAGYLVPSKLYAALAAQRPCIYVGPAGTEIAAVLQDYKAGSVVPQNDPRRLADEIIAYRMDGSKWFESHKGAKKASEDFTAEASIKSWIACAEATIRYPAG